MAETTSTLVMVFSTDNPEETKTINVLDYVDGVTAEQVRTASTAIIESKIFSPKGQPLTGLIKAYTRVEEETAVDLG